jgi:hypothetical protein
MVPWYAESRKPLGLDHARPAPGTCGAARFKLNPPSVQVCSENMDGRGGGVAHVTMTQRAI